MNKDGYIADTAANTKQILTRTPDRFVKPQSTETRGSAIAEGPHISGTLHWRLSK